MDFSPLTDGIQQIYSLTGGQISLTDKIKKSGMPIRNVDMPGYIW